MLPSQRALFDIPADVCVPERGRLEPAAARHPGGGARRPSRARASRGSSRPTSPNEQHERARKAAAALIGADAARCRARLVGRLRRRDRRQGADDRAAARACWCSRTITPRRCSNGSRAPTRRASRSTRSRSRRTATGPRPCWKRSSGRARRRSSLASISSIHWSDGGHARHAQDPRGAAAARRGAAGRRHAQRRRDRDRREDARSGFSDLPDLQMGARPLRARLRLCREAPPGRRAARADLVRAAQRQGREPGLLRRHALSARRAALRHGRARSFHLDGNGRDRHGDDGVVGRGRGRRAPVRVDAAHRRWLGGANACRFRTSASARRTS